MSVAELGGLLVSIATLVSSVAGLIVASGARQRINQTHELVNGMSTRNVILEKQESRAEGVASVRD